ncbi:hypothetical protein DFQ28_006634 [Apophysomyces sp. BC1034]|nr:hypothetical protein DFQ29_000792 [Apophysomyces sp. BC1021]KAG0194785.1 hypothetical protein DFQ28_006634 [Apophysomyces sp. BC1034]
MTSFIHEDGLGNMIDEDGKDVVMMESDSHLFPVEMITDYDQYMGLKPPERIIIMKTESDEEKLNEPITPNRMSTRAAALQLQIKPRTAQYWVQQDQKEPTDQIVKNVGGGRPTGRPPKLVEEHRQFLIDLIDEKPSLVLDEIITSLTEQLADLNIKPLIEPTYSLTPLILSASPQTANMGVDIASAKRVAIVPSGYVEPRRT